MKGQHCGTVHNNTKTNYSHYNMITPNVAIGDHLSSYEPFDVIVNLCFPENGVNHRQIAIGYKNGKTIIRVGINDQPNEDMSSLLSHVIPYLVTLRSQNPNLRILFHCYAGISRSSTVAIAYLMKVYGLSLGEAFQLAQMKRSIVRPNPGFANALQAFINNMNNM